MSQTDLHTWFLSELFDQVPMKIAVIDRDLNIVQANRHFMETFGEWTGRHCYELYKGRDSKCENCNAERAFEQGCICVSREYMTDKNGATRFFLVHVTPLRTDDGSIPYIVEISIDVSQIINVQQEYELLFDSVPNYITILDRSLQVVQANKAFREVFGNDVGENAGNFCYRKFKQQAGPCCNCPALKVIEDGQVHTAAMTGLDKDGEPVHYVVTASPLINEKGEITNIMEIATDTTLVRTLETQLEQAFKLQETAIASSFDGMIIAGPHESILLFNKSAEKITGYASSDIHVFDDLKPIFPQGFLKTIWEDQGSCVLPETTIHSKTGDAVPVRLSGTILKNGNGVFGTAIYIHDLSEIKRLESEKLVAERLAAVGQTVAGLAHGIKNILTGLEGGLFVMNSGLGKADVDMIQKGLSMLESNIGRITHVVKEFLNFARGREPSVHMADPAAVAHEIVDLFQDAALKEGVRLVADLPATLPEAPIDSEGIHTCLANLVSNAIDACLMSENADGVVGFKVWDRDGVICYEVTDNGIGMDYEVKKKLFTSFFSTKGSHEGTGLGLLVTRKIIQEHGGRVAFESTEGKGATFRIELDRSRLPAPREDEK
jgi:PAS domain S-box-containing protein